jgi:hypothetical protein
MNAVKNDEPASRDASGRFADLPGAATDRA